MGRWRINASSRFLGRRIPSVCKRWNESNSERKRSCGSGIERSPAYETEKYRPHGQHVLEFGNEKFNIHTYVGEFTPYAKQAAAGCADFCLIADGDIYEIKKELEDAVYK